MSEEYKFGVCHCDLESYEPKVKNLIKFDSYEDACKYYMEHCLKNNNLYLDSDLWIVWIDRENNRICQFEQLKRNTKCKLVNLESKGD